MGLLPSSEKSCTKCGILKSVNLENFPPSKKTHDGFGCWCRTCLKKTSRDYQATKEGLAVGNKRTKEWQARNRQQYLQAMKDRHNINRLLVLQHYSNGDPKCACCGESEWKFLAIDHVNGGGKKHRSVTSSCLADWIVRNNYPDGFRVLCHNCNFARGIYGKCPHEQVGSFVREAKDVRAIHSKCYGRTLDFSCGTSTAEYKSARLAAIRFAVLSHYSNGEPSCECCGERELGFLAIDHINGGGSAHHREVRCPMDVWLFKNHFPSGFRVLCHKCNFSTGLYGACGHEQLTETSRLVVMSLARENGPTAS